MLMVGGVRSMLTAVEVVAELPAKSAAIPITVWFCPSVERTTGGVQIWTPLKLSLHKKLIVAGELFQPKELAAGLWLGRIVGGVLSMLICTLAVALLPAKSKA